MPTRQSPGPAARLSERDVSFLKLLKTLKAAGGTAGTAGADLGVVRRIAAWYDSAPVLAFLAAQPRWYGDWQVREGLLRNDRTPPRVRRELEMSVAVLELLRDLDAPDLAPAERAEIGEDLRRLVHALAEPDRRAVKGRAHELSASRRAGTPGGPTADGTGTVAARLPVSRADDALTQVLGELVPTGEIPPAPGATGGLPGPGRGAAGEGGAAPPGLDLLAQEVASIAAADDARMHEALREVEAATWGSAGPTDLDDAEVELVEADLLGPDEAATAEAAPALLPAARPVPPAAASPPLSPPAPPAPSTPSTLPAPAAPPVPPALPAPPTGAAQPDPPALGPPRGTAPGPGLAALPRADRARLAAGTADADVLAQLVHDHDGDVQVALAGNPALSEAHAVVLARHASSRAAEAIHRNRRHFCRPTVQRAFLECPQAPSVALLEIVNGMGRIPDLLALLRNPKVRYLEVKAKARGRLGAIFRSLSPGEKVAVIHRAGRGIVKELWTDFFRDEALVLRCLKEQQLDEAVVLEIARSKVAPRRALELIGTSAAWAANPAIRLELVLNPRTPRPVATRLVQKLGPADRKLVRGNPALPESVRRYA
jgi:hypothetical protein